ncbi:cell division protein FtsQ [Anaplasma marginale]|uniref:cell division protein FtsQ/DivIB n=2 Tax=Anaplasma marginale TaxID=770 RepID=UPI0003093A97|nr:cell division protein FtsQ/DivIB [Anaplasma marginale]AXW83806.1 cell division protein FtsQ [Anaplasma marginale]AXW85444.1 cell division protein FtsQ [Anaplasma marginale]KAA8472011.1 FtsQ-type POTRA domain-containing protein [Anaplasma marginale]KAB0450745.1 FtsQ-type POTRA domain-containing protein [Anaplasma marginale]KAB0452131.1 FtsQ-type POTRA domain-containing protein [Anaplasma marginale]
MCKDAAGNRAIVAHSAPLCMRVVRHIFVVGAVVFVAGWGVPDFSIKSWLGGLSSAVSSALIEAGFSTREVVIRGNSVVSTAEILNMINKDSSIILLSLRTLRSRIKSHSPWVKEVAVHRELANGILRITVEEYVAFANWRHHGMNSIIDNTGHVIVNSDERLDNLVSIYGDEALEGLHFVREVLNNGGMLSTMVSSFSWLGNRRWDVGFSSGLQVKLPENNPQAAWNYLAQLYKSSGELLMWKVVDMRIPDKIFIKK